MPRSLAHVMTVRHSPGDRTDVVSMAMPGVMLETLVTAYLLLPAGIANAVPPIATRLLGPGRPIDGGRTFLGNPLFGAHKTWQGVAAGMLGGVMTFFVQRAFDGIYLPVLFAIAISAGALAGDVVKSFFKRRFAAAPGRAWFPFDQCDYVIGALIAAAPFIRLTFPVVAGTIAVYVVLHLVVSAAGFFLGVKESAI